MSNMYDSRNNFRIQTDEINVGPFVPFLLRLQTYYHPRTIWDSRGQRLRNNLEKLIELRYKHIEVFRLEKIELIRAPEIRAVLELSML